MSDEIPNFRVNGYLGSVSDVLRKPESTLAEFAWHFANDSSEDHGAVSVRSDGRHGYPVPRRLEVNPYYQQRLDEARAEVERLEALTHRNEHDTSRLLAAAGEWLIAVKAGHDQLIADRERRIARGQRMLDAIDAWDAPPLLADLKSAMKKSLTMSLSQAWPALTEPTMPTNLAAWHGERLGLARELLEHTAKELVAETEKVKSLNAWLDAMYGAFGEPVPYEQS